jgi:xanthine phosphoribosyltransferase
MTDRPVPPPMSVAVSWTQFHKDARRLAAQVSVAGEFSAIVAVTRGGLAPAAIVARELGVRVVDTLGLSSYTDENRQGALAMIKPLTEVIHRRPASQIVAIDDLADTGATARAVRELLPGAHLATLYVKPLGRATVDSFVEEFPQDCWVYFPWDLGDDNLYRSPMRRA